MAQIGGGGMAAKRGKLSSSGAGAGAAGEDRLSALPDDVLVLILVRIGLTAEAARTSVLSRRWRHLWPLLPELRFDDTPDGHRIGEVLGAPDPPPPLRFIYVFTEDSSPDSLEAWLPVAARRLSGDLFYFNALPFKEKVEEEEEEEEEDQAGESDAGAVQLPCFESATGINISLALLGLALPPAGTFARLVNLALYCVRLRGPCELSDVVSSQRCPSLQRLTAGCTCDQPANWKTEELSLNRLTEVEVTDLRGAEHEIAFMERLFSWATMLKKMEITFDCSVTKSKARELLQTLASFSRPEALVEFYMYDDADKESTYVLTPEDKEL
ncbi:unnamed protein product [Urochloa decumbens]|uniref:F-box domain-containing protein n=1 Tax=Urochloa decumbens TaxID=240449 RepID=A0ABC9FLE8_9POAL